MRAKTGDAPDGEPGTPLERESTTAWYAAEVPGIVAGLETSAAISVATAATARQLIDAGACDRALRVALDEAF
jgi:hypothetical protein